MKHITQYPNELHPQVEAYTQKLFAFDDAHSRASWTRARQLAKELIPMRNALEVGGCVFTDSHVMKTCMNCYVATETRPCSHCGSDNVANLN